MRRAAFPVLLIGATLVVSAAVSTHSAVAADVQYPIAVAVSPDGEVYLADRNLPGIWKWNEGKPEKYFVGEKRFRTPLNAIRCLAFDREGRLLAGDSSTRQIYRFNESGQPEPLAQPISDQLGPLGIPMSLAVNSAGEIFVSDLELHCIWKLPADGGEPTEFADLQAPVGLCVDTQDRLWAVSRVENQLWRFGADGKAEKIVPGVVFEFPHSVAVGPDGVAYVSDGYGKVIWRVADEQAPEKWCTSDKFVNPVDVKWHDDALWIIDPRARLLFTIRDPDAVEAQAIP